MPRIELRILYLEVSSRRAPLIGKPSFAKSLYILRVVLHRASLFKRLHLRLRLSSRYRSFPHVLAMSTNLTRHLG